MDSPLGSSAPKLILASALLVLGLYGGSAACGQSVAPQLTSISLTSSPTLAAGQNVTYSFAVTPGTAPSIQSVGLSVFDADGFLYFSPYFTALSSASGTITTATSPSTWLQGSYTVYEIMVTGSANITTTYNADRTISYSNGGTGPATSSISFAALGFSLTGGLAAIESAQLTSISLASPATLTAGSTPSYNYSITPGTLGTIDELDVLLEDPTGAQFNILVNPASTSGTLSYSTPTSWVNGAYSVLSISVADSHGIANYLPTGTIS